MTRAEFSELIKPMLQVFLPISNSALDIYYAQLKDTDPKVLEQAVKELINTHKEGWFPQIAEFQEIIHDKQRPILDVPVLGITRCHKCNDTGVILKEEKWYGHPYTIAHPCSCEEGEIWKQAWGNYKQMRGKTKGGKKKNVMNITSEDLYKNLGG